MEREKVKDILLFFKNIDQAITLNKRFINNIEEQYYSLNSGTLSGMPTKSNKISRPTEKTALYIPDSESETLRELNAEIEQLCNLKIAIIKELNKLPFPQKSIIYDFYIAGFHWVYISERIHYSERQCKNIRNRALDKLGWRFSQNVSISSYNYPTL